MEGAWVPLLLTLKVAGWATALNLFLGVGVGYVLARKRFWGRDLLDAILTLPMVMPPTVLGYYLLVLVGRRGPIGAWLQSTFGITLIFTWQGAVIAATIVAFPLVFKSARAAFESIDPQLEQAGEFGATLMVAGSIPGKTQTLSVAVYEAVQAGQDDVANFLVLVTSITCIVVLLTAGRLVPGRVTGPG